MPLTRVALVMLLAFAVGIGAIALAARIILDRRMVQRLRRDQPALWTELGEPRPSFTRLEDVSGLHRFLFDARYAQAGDAALQADRVRLRRVHVATYTLAAAALGLGVALRWTRG